jgi:hypothetical protein
MQKLLHARNGDDADLRLKVRKWLSNAHDEKQTPSEVPVWSYKGTSQLHLITVNRHNCVTGPRKSSNNTKQLIHQGYQYDEISVKGMAGPCSLKRLPQAVPN